MCLTEEGVGGRFSFASPVGLLPFAVTAGDEQPRERGERALAGYAEAHRRFFETAADAPDNTACQLARWWHLGEQFGRKTDMVFCNYADDAKLSDWFGQLYEESIQERGEGLNIIGTRGPTGNHSLLNGILRGPHDKLVMLLRWADLGPDVSWADKYAWAPTIEELRPERRQARSLEQAQRTRAARKPAEDASP